LGNRQARAYFTTSVSFWLCVDEPDVAVTTMVYVPAVVLFPFGFVGAGAFPPPQAHNINANAGANLHRDFIGTELTALNNEKHPSIASAHSHNPG
jgi:hypothetical protein